jgi:hypothetical protein
VGSFFYFWGMNGLFQAQQSQWGRRAAESMCDVRKASTGEHRRLLLTRACLGSEDATGSFARVPLQVGNGDGRCSVGKEQGRRWRVIARGSISLCL